jgi:hypothetical protein
MGEIKIICDDALKWLKKQRDSSLNTIVTGIPDLDELVELDYQRNNKEDYIRFFENTVELVLNKINPDEYAIFMQTDRKMNGEWIDKSHITISKAQEMGYKLLWHKIIVNREGTYIQRPTYTHLLCFSRNNGPGEAFPDVLSCGQHLYKNGSPPNAICYVMEFLKKKGVENIVDPFAGRGTIPFIASVFNINSLGIDIDPKQCEAARNITKDRKIINILKNTDYFKNI